MQHEVLVEDVLVLLHPVQHGGDAPRVSALLPVVVVREAVRGKRAAEHPRNGHRRQQRQSWRQAPEAHVPPAQRAIALVDARDEVQKRDLAEVERLVERVLQHLLERDRLVGVERPARLVPHPVLLVGVLEVVGGGEGQRRARDAEQNVEGDASGPVHGEPQRVEPRAPGPAPGAFPVVGTRRHARRDVRQSHDENRDVHRAHRPVTSAVSRQEQPPEVGRDEREDEFQEEERHGRRGKRVRLRHELGEALKPGHSSTVSVYAIT